MQTQRNFTKQCSVSMGDLQFPDLIENNLNHMIQQAYRNHCINLSNYHRWNQLITKYQAWKFWSEQKEVLKNDKSWKFCCLFLNDEFLSGILKLRCWSRPVKSDQLNISLPKNCVKSVNPDFSMLAIYRKAWVSTPNWTIESKKVCFQAFTRCSNDNRTSKRFA